MTTEQALVQLPAAACLALCEGLPRAASLDAAMHIVNGVRQQLLGDGLLTVNVLGAKGPSVNALSAKLLGVVELDAQGLGATEQAEKPLAMDELANSPRAAPAPSTPAAHVILQRVWSSNPAAYPPGGVKHKSLTPWSRQLLVQGQVFVGEGDAELARAFDDHALITRLGLHSVVNVPLLSADQQCYATFNVLTQRLKWRTDEVLLVQLLAALAAPAIKKAAQQAFA